MAEPRYGGIYQPKEAAEAVDPKIEIDKKCGVGCTGVWEIYEKCAVRIEEKGRGDCAGYYMDYFKCIDKCSTKQLMKTLA